MPKFAIPKKVTFEELGAEYKNSYLTFRTVPTSDFEWMESLLDKSKKNPTVPLPTLIKALEKYFLDGKFYDYDSKKELDVDAKDIGSFNSDVIVKCFKAISGSIDPKDAQRSPLPSTTDQKPA